MEEKKKGMLDVLAADEIHRYMEGFDADEAVRLSNDMDYIGFILSQNPMIVELRAAYKAMNEYLASVKGQVTFSCGGDCSSCAEACAAKPEQKDGEA